MHTIYDAARPGVSRRAGFAWAPHMTATPRFVLGPDSGGRELAIDRCEGPPRIAFGRCKYCGEYDSSGRRRRARHVLGVARRRRGASMNLLARIVQSNLIPRRSGGTVYGIDRPRFFAWHHRQHQIIECAYRKPARAKNLRSYIHLEEYVSDHEESKRRAY